MRILVTGAAGFIGGALARTATERGFLVTVMDKVWGTSTAQVGAVERTVRQYRCDVIIHLGASCSSQLSLRNPETDFTDNVVGTFQVCEAARQTGVPVIFNSTMKVMPGVDGRLTPYGVSKQVGETYLRTYGDLYDVRYVINRPSSVYGPGQRGSEDGGWVTHFMRCALEGTPIRLWAPRSNSRDVLYVDDHVDLLLDQVVNLDAYQRRTFDVGGGPGNEISIGDLLSWLEVRFGPVEVVDAPSLPGDVQRVVNDNTEVTAVNGWRPKTHWLDGLEKTLEWMKNGA